MNDQASADTFADDVSEIIRQLTAIARRTYTAPDGSQQRHDFGEVISVAVTAAAANLGGTEELLAGRPGSWESHYVRQIIASTAGEHDLARYRTEPLMLLLDPETIFEDAGLREQFDEADDELSAGYHNGTEPDDGGVNDAAVDARRQALEAGYTQALDAYFAAYVDSVQNITGQLGISARIEVKRVVDYRVEPGGESLADVLHTIALERTPLPEHIVPKSPGRPEK